MKNIYKFFTYSSKCIFNVTHVQLMTDQTRPKKVDNIYVCMCIYLLGVCCYKQTRKKL